MAKHHHRAQGAAGMEMIEITLAVPRDRVGMLKHYATRLARNRPARREEVIGEIHRHSREIRQRFAGDGLWIFGSLVLNESKRHSDVDLLVAFAPGHPEGLLDFVSLKQWLENVLSRPVDLVTPANLKPRLRPGIMREAVRVL
jgi:predicted nucleotidyltransferase